MLKQSILALGAVALLSGCTEPNKKLSEAFNDRWGDVLNELNTQETLYVCNDGYATSSVSSGSCLVSLYGPRYKFHYSSDSARVIGGVKIRNEGKQWIVSVSNNIYDDVTFKEVNSYVNKATKAYVDGAKSKRKIEATWE